MAVRAEKPHLPGSMNKHPRKIGIFPLYAYAHVFHICSYMLYTSKFILMIDRT
jgi:hypothetical protein